MNEKSQMITQSTILAMGWTKTMIKNLKGKIGKDKAYFVFKKAVLDKIASVYPKYAAECQKQAEAIGVACYA